MTKVAFSRHDIRGGRDVFAVSASVQQVPSSPPRNTLRTTVEYAEAPGTVTMRGLPMRINCRISAALDSHDLLQVAESVREAVVTACHEHLGLTALPVDIHVEDLHEL